MRFLPLLIAVIVVIVAEVLWLRSYLAEPASHPEEVVGGVSLVVATLLVGLGTAATLYRFRAWRKVLILCTTVSAVLLLLSYAVLTRW